jgi:hypothetical protein
MADDMLQQLKTATDGLEYPSESDAPFDAFLWPAKGAMNALALITARAHAGQKIEQVPVDSFFADLSDSDDGARFAQLRRLLQSRLNDLHIFRVGAGETTVHIYLIGKTLAGEWAGLHTTSIET